LFHYLPFFVWCGRWNQEFAMDGVDLSFKSPVSKLLRFFVTSRDGWKAKHHQLQRQLKKEQNQVRAVERSRQEWRTRAEAAQQRIRELESELAESQK
jgi:hypothetical protein